MVVSKKTAEKELTIQDKEKERLALENESLSQVIQETIQWNEEALREKDAEIQQLQVYCVYVHGQYVWSSVTNVVVDV